MFFSRAPLRSSCARAPLIITTSHKPLARSQNSLALLSKHTQLSVTLMANRRYNARHSSFGNPRRPSSWPSMDQAAYLNALPEHELLAYCKKLVMSKFSETSKQASLADEGGIQGSPRSEDFTLWRPRERSLRQKASRERKYQEETIRRQMRKHQKAVAASHETAANTPRTSEKRPKTPRQLWGIKPLILRDGCQCHLCVDPSSKQKNFQSTDLKLEDVENFTTTALADGKFEVIWGKGPDPHVSVFDVNDLKYFQGGPEMGKRYGFPVKSVPWDAKEILKRRLFMSYAEYMSNDETLFEALSSLHEDGILILKDVPTTEKAVENIGSRIGVLRDTFYGRTWDVKSVPEAKNVAYTQQYLGLHQDLLYVADPPGLQLLHCLQNTCTGGTSLFSDGLKAADSLSSFDYENLACTAISYRYENDGQWYNQRRRVIEHGTGSYSGDRCINYSPPFQAPQHRFENNSAMIGENFASLQKFTNFAESKQNLFEYRLQEGDCVIFNNRRILHGRMAFDAAGGERWLKGTYIDTDVFKSKFKVLENRFKPQEAEVATNKEITLEDRLKEFEEKRKR